MALKWKRKLTTGELGGGRGDEADLTPTLERLERGKPHEFHPPPSVVFLRSSRNFFRIGGTSYYSAANSALPPPLLKHQNPSSLPFSKVGTLLEV